MAGKKLKLIDLYISVKTEIQDIKQRFGIIGRSPLLDRAISIAMQVAPTDMSVLIIGESGVGKENFPKIIHQTSLRKHNSYIAVNCGAIPEGTIDSELFGHLKGSFTGAMNDRKGYFQEANGGTIFLDEVGELPLSTQARLLRVLETGEFIPVGASQAMKTDVRIVAATNVNLEEAVRQGRFREDLLFRLNTVPIQIPPLRKRREDIALLFRYFASQAGNKYHMPPLRLTPEAEDLLQNYDWVGNIRELRNLADRISVLEEERLISKTIVEQYLPKAMDLDYRPALRNDRSEQMSGASNPMLWKLYMDLRQEVSELKSVVASLLQGSMPKYSEGGASKELMPSPRVLAPQTETSESYQANVWHSDEFGSHGANTEDVEAQIIEARLSSDESTSLEDMERNMIISALKRHHGKRRPTADELKISERTLYRKIKEYGLDL